LSISLLIHNSFEKDYIHISSKIMLYSLSLTSKLTKLVYKKSGKFISQNLKISSRNLPSLKIFIPHSRNAVVCTLKFALQSYYVNDWIRELNYTWRPTFPGRCSHLLLSPQYRCLAGLIGRLPLRRTWRGTALCWFETPAAGWTSVWRERFKTLLPILCPPPTSCLQLG